MSGSDFSSPETAHPMCHVLIIEDEPLIALLIETLVEDAGATSWEIAVAQDEAVAAALAHPPDVITSDIQLLEGTGPGAVAAIHAQFGAGPVIYVTATPDACKPLPPSSIMLRKPLQTGAFTEDFRGMC